MSKKKLILATFKHFSAVTFVVHVSSSLYTCRSTRNFYAMMMIMIMMMGSLMIALLQVTFECVSEIIGKLVNI